MAKKLIVCEYCDAEYKVQHNMDEEYYTIRGCPFCLAETSEEDFELMSYDEDEDED